MKINVQKDIKKIVLNFKHKEISNLSTEFLDQRSFNLDLNRGYHRIFSIVKPSENSREEIMIGKELNEKSKDKCDFEKNLCKNLKIKDELCQKFESDVLLLHYFKNHKLIYAEKLLIVNGICNSFSDNLNNLKIECILDNKDLHMQIILLKPHCKAIELGSISIDSPNHSKEIEFKYSK